MRFIHSRLQSWHDSSLLVKLSLNYKENGDYDASLEASTFASNKVAIQLCKSVQLLQKEQLLWK